MAQQSGLLAAPPEDPRIPNTQMAVRKVSRSNSVGLTPFSSLRGMVCMLSVDTHAGKTTQMYKIIKNIF